MNLIPAIPIAAQTAVQMAASVADATSGFPQLLGQAIESISPTEPRNAASASQSDHGSAAPKTPAELIEHVDSASLVSLREQAEEVRAQFEQGFRELLQQAGIDLFPGILLQVQGDGTIAASGHPDAATIEQLIRDDARLAGGLRRLAGIQSLMHRELADVYDFYGQDPLAAMNRNRESFEVQQQPFELFIEHFGGNLGSYS